MNPLSPEFTNILTKRAKNALERSFVIAKEHPIKNSIQVTPLHLLYALYQEKGSVAANILDAHNLKQQHFSGYFKKSERKAKVLPQNAYSLSASCKTALKKAANQAMEHGHPLIGTEHILYGTITRITTFDGIPANKIIKIKTHIEDILQHSMPVNIPMDISTADLGSFDHDSFEKELSNILNNKKDVDEQDYEEVNDEAETEIKVKNKEENKVSILDAFCSDLTRKAKKKQLDPLIGREQELNRIIRILVRKNKNNPLLVGDAGVGKTALAEGLAQRIADRKVPAQLIKKRVLSLDLSSVLAGTVYRGEFEERMHELIEEASSQDVILFFDEVHMLMGAGAAQGSLDAANILKPALARGEFQCIGATTHDEFKKSIEKDSALDRRFQKLIIKEQTPEEALQTLRKLKPYYEKHHGVKIPAQILKLCVDLSMRYIPSRALPDKALDILDEVSSHAKSMQALTKEEKELLSLELSLEEILKEKERATKKELYKKAIHLKSKEETIKEKITAIAKNKKTTSKNIEITQDHVFHVVAEMTGIPISALSQNKLEEIKNLEITLKNNIIGQDHAIEKIISTIKRNQAGIRNASRPMGSFLLLGPSGSGKTLTAKILANLMENTKIDLHRNPSTLIRLDMSEFSESHSVAKLIGAPPGYIGYDESSSLVDKLRVSPYSVVLFDEIEKAHPQVFNVLLQMLEDGSLTDSQGKNANLRNTVIILTSNIGAKNADKKELGFFENSAKNESVLFSKSLKEVMRPEIINRLDEVIVFKKLDKKSMKKIARMHLKQLNSNIKGKASIQCKPNAYAWIIEKASNDERGARGIRRIIETQIEDPVSEIILSSTGKTKIIIKEDGGVLKLENAS